MGRGLHSMAGRNTAADRSPSLLLRLSQLSRGLATLGRSEAWLLRPSANVKEQCLANHRLYVVGMEWLGDQERGFRPRTGEKTLWIGSNEDDR